MPNVLRLPLRFDADSLAADVAGVREDEWTPHFNVHYHDGGWSGVALRAVGGDGRRLFPDPEARESYADTPLLARCPGVRAVLAQIRCPVTSVRLLRLAAGSRIREHRDFDLAFEDGEIRLHVPVLTHPAVEFVVGGERVEMRPGECWYLNLNLPHRVENRGDRARVHLVLDCEVDDWLASLFPPEMAVPGREAFARFADLVLVDPGLQEALRRESDTSRFVSLAVRLGRERGERFGARDVREAIRAAQRSWLERWL